MDDKISLQQIKDITISITDKNGNIASLVYTGEELIERINSVMYQTLCHALTSGVSEILATMSLDNIKNDKAIQYMQKKKVRQDVSISVGKSWKDEYYFQIDKEFFYYNTEVEANYILQHVKYLNFKLSFK